MKRRTFLAAGLSAAVPHLSSARDTSRILRFIPEGDLNNPDPVWTTTTVAGNHAMMIWDTLYGTTLAGNSSPQMVEGHEVSSDLLTWRFTLRQELSWHDGEPVLARDCVPSILRWARRRGYGERLLSQLEEIKPLDDRRFEIRLRKPYPLMISALARGFCFMMPERIAKTDSFQQINEYIGSGPYIFQRDEWIQGAQAVYSRNERYVPAAGPPENTAGAKVANFDRVEWIVVPDAATAAAALHTGQVDWWQKPAPDLLGELRKAPGVRVFLNDTVGVIAMMVFNHLQPPCNNPKFLRALLPAIDQREFMQAVWGEAADMYQLPCGAFTPGSTMANDAGIEALTGKRDLSLAKRLIEQAGYKGERIVLMSPLDYPLESTLSLVTEDLFRRLDLNVDYVAMDWGTLVKRRTSKEAPERGGWSTYCAAPDGRSIADPMNHFPIRGNGPDAWFGWPTSAKLEGLRDQWFDAPDAGSQKNLCEQMQQAVWNSVPFIPLGQSFSPTAVRSDLTDIVKAPFPVFWGVRKT